MKKIFLASFVTFLAFKCCKERKTDFDQQTECEAVNVKTSWGKKLKMHISTSHWSVQHLNTGQNIQHMLLVQHATILSQCSYSHIYVDKAACRHFHHTQETLFFVGRYESIIGCIFYSNVKQEKSRLAQNLWLQFTTAVGHLISDCCSELTLEKESSRGGWVV